MKLLKNPIVSFVLIFFSVFILFKLPQHGLENACDRIIVESAVKITKSSINDNWQNRKKILFDYKVEKNKPMMIIGNLDLDKRNEQGKPQILIWKLEMRGFAYLPIILFLSLVIASPVPWKRKVVFGLLGLFFIHIFIAFKLFLVTMTAQRAVIATQSGYSSFMISIFDWLTHYFVTDTINVSIMIVIVLWIIVIFRVSDINKLKQYFSTSFPGLSPKNVNTLEKEREKPVKKQSDKSDKKELDQKSKIIISKAEIKKRASKK